MERVKNSLLKDFFENIFSTLKNIVTSGEVDNDVELEGELKNDPLEALKNIQSSSIATQKVVTRTRAKDRTSQNLVTPEAQKVRTPKVSRQPRTNSIDDEREQ